MRLSVILLALAPVLLSAQSTRAKRFHGIIDDPHRSILPAAIPVTEAQAFFQSFKVRPKSTFETTDEYKARASKMDDTLYYLFALTTTRPLGCLHKISYDADAEALTISLEVESGGLRVSCMAAPGSSYVGTNGFGAKRTIQRMAQMDLAFKTPGINDYESTHDLVVPMPRDSARQLAGRLALAVLVGPRQFDNGSWIDEEDISSSPTMDNPVEVTGTRFALKSDNLLVFLYDTKTRRILYSKLI